MAGILDFLSGAPDLSSLQQLGVDPNQVAAYQQIQKQAQSAALGPALFGAVLNALAGPRRGAGTRALEGAGRAYESAEQQAIAQPMAMVNQSRQGKLAALKQQETAVHMDQMQQSIEASKAHVDYLDFLKKNNDKAIAPDMATAELTPFLSSKQPEVRQMATMLQGQAGRGIVNGGQFAQGINEMAKLESLAAHPGNHIGAVGSADTGYTVYATDPNGHMIASSRIAGQATGSGGYGMAPKIEAKVHQDYNAWNKRYMHNRQFAANKLGQAGKGNVSFNATPMPYSIWLKSEDGKRSIVANGGKVNPNYGKDMPPAYGEVVMPAKDSPFKEGEEHFVPSLGYWVKRKGDSWIRIDEPLKPGKNMTTGGMGGLGVPDPTETPSAAPTASPETNAPASDDETPNMD